MMLLAYLIRLQQTTALCMLKGREPDEFVLLMQSRNKQVTSSMRDSAQNGEAESRGTPSAFYY
jgi:hypothetical protein